ncbi:MAG: 4Fe-4S dicluster domain-containing protein [Promethearchaeota archaeon]
MSWPKISKSITDGAMETEMRFLNKKVGLRIDRSKCIGCGICTNVCPKDAMARGPVGAIMREGGNQEVTLALDLVPEVITSRCVYCGTCASLCPTFAITILENEEPVQPDQLLVVKEKAIPTLKREVVETSKAKVLVSKYWDFDITHDNEKCAGGCMTCVYVCPTEALHVPKKFKGGWNVNKKVELDETKCIGCAACLQTCPADSLTITRKNIAYEGEFNEPFWPNLVEKLENPVKKTLEDIS